MQQLDSAPRMPHREPPKDPDEHRAFSASIDGLNVQLNGRDARRQAACAAHEDSADPLRHLLTHSDIGLLALDHDMRVRFYTPLAAKLLNLRVDHIDRPIGQLPDTGAGSVLEQQAGQAIDSMVAVDRDVWSGDTPQTRRCYLRRIVPYTSDSDSTGGAIIAFMDITERRRMEERLEAHVTRRTRELGEREIRLQAIMNSVVDAIVIIGVDDRANLRLLRRRVDRTQCQHTHALALPRRTR
jgi:PAS domain-containing protein